MKHTISCSAQAAEQAQAAAPSTSVSCLFSSQPGAIAKTERQLQLLKNSAQQKDTHSAWAVGKFLVSQHQTSSTHFTEAVTCPWALVLSQGNCSTPPQLDKVFSLMKAVVRWELSRMSAGGRMKSHTTVSLASSFPHLPYNYGLFTPFHCWSWNMLNFGRCWWSFLCLGLLSLMMTFRGSFPGH